MFKLLNKRDPLSEDEQLPEGIVQTIAISENVGGKVSQSTIDLMLRVRSGELTTEQAIAMANEELTASMKARNIL